MLPFTFWIGLHYSHSQNFVLSFISVSQAITSSQEGHFHLVKKISSIPHCLGTILAFLIIYSISIYLYCYICSSV